MITGLDTPEHKKEVYRKAVEHIEKQNISIRRSTQKKRDKLGKKEKSSISIPKVSISKGDVLTTLNTNALRDELARRGWKGKLTMEVELEIGLH